MDGRSQNQEIRRAVMPSGESHGTVRADDQNGVLLIHTFAPYQAEQTSVSRLFANKSIVLFIHFLFFRSQQAFQYLELQKQMNVSWTCVC